MSDEVEKKSYSVWNPPKNAHDSSLDFLASHPTTEQQVAEVREAVRDEVEERTRAYKTQISAETLTRTRR